LPLLTSERYLSAAQQGAASDVEVTDKLIAHTKKGAAFFAVIKATEVMIEKD
jgi:hypothetical protein